MVLFLYQIFIYIYLLGVDIASLFSEKVKKMRHGEHAAFRQLKEKIQPGARYVWVHAASLGEFEQGRPLIEEIRKNHSEYKILLTFFSPSGYEVRKNYEGADIITYLPLDTYFNARHFFKLVQPEMAFFIKYEFWPNYLINLWKRRIPVYSVSSIFRKEQVFFKSWGWSYARLLKCFTHIFVQNEESKDLLATLGIKNVSVSGDTRFDRVMQIKNEAKELPLVEQFIGGSDKVFIAGSSWQPDEEIFIPFFAEQKDWKLIIAPHVIGESHLQQIENLLQKNGISAIRYTELQKQTTPFPIKEDGPESRALIVNCFGLLSSIYRYATIAYIGGGFGVGIHNLPEAAVWGIPVFFGPNNQKFREAQALKACGGGLEIHSASEFAEKISYLMDSDESLKVASKASADYTKSQTGAIKMILDGLFPTGERQGL